MRAKTYLVERQIAWARRHGIELIDNPHDRRPVGEYCGQANRTAYAVVANANLFEPLSSGAKAEFQAGAGNELSNKMLALYSSSALAANLFHPLHGSGLFDIAAAGLGMRGANVRTLSFEQKRPVMGDPRSRGFRQDPTLDVVFTMADGGRLREVAAEVKFREPWSDRPSGFRPRWLGAADLWETVPNCFNLARRIGQEDDGDKVHTHLHAAQLLRHLIGLLFRNDKNGFELAYLWYDVPGAEGDVHRRELEQFATVLAADDIRFRPVSCQEYVLNLMAHRTAHPEFIDYLADRYL
jgi:hypothetical protein